MREKEDVVSNEEGLLCRCSGHFRGSAPASPLGPEWWLLGPPVLAARARTAAVSRVPAQNQACAYVHTQPCVSFHGELFPGHPQPQP